MTGGAADNLRLLFPGMEIVESSPFRVTRDAEVAVQELESDDLLETIDKIKSRPNPNLRILGVVITLHDKRTVIGKDVSDQIATVFGDKVFKTTISKSVMAAIPAASLVAMPVISATASMSSTQPWASTASTATDEPGGSTGTYPVHSVGWTSS